MHLKQKRCLSCLPFFIIHSFIYAATYFPPSFHLCFHIIFFFSFSFSHSVLLSTLALSFILLNFFFSFVRLSARYHYIYLWGFPFRRPNKRIYRCHPHSLCINMRAESSRFYSLFVSLSRSLSLFHHPLLPVRNLFIKNRTQNTLAILGKCVCHHDTVVDDREPSHRESSRASRPFGQHGAGRYVLS